MKEQEMIQAIMKAKRDAEQRKYKSAYNSIMPVIDELLKLNKEMEITTMKLELEVARLKDLTRPGMSKLYDYLNK
jgi:hypothetical protein